MAARPTSNTATPTAASKPVGLRPNLRLFTTGVSRDSSMLELLCYSIVGRAIFGLPPSSAVTLTATGIMTHAQNYLDDYGNVHGVYRLRHRHAS